MLSIAADSAADGLSSEGKVEGAGDAHEEEEDDAKEEEEGVAWFLEGLDWAVDEAMTPSPLFPAVWHPQCCLCGTGTRSGRCLYVCVCVKRPCCWL